MSSSDAIMSIKLSHPSENVMAMCKLIGFTVKSGWLKGDLKTSPKGTPVPTWGRGLSYAVVSLDFSMPLSINLERVFTVIGAAETVVENFHCTGGNIALYITVASGTGLVFDLKTLRSLSDLRISLQIDTYENKTELVVSDHEDFIEMASIDPVMSLRLLHPVEKVMDLCRRIGFRLFKVDSGEGMKASADGAPEPSTEIKDCSCVLVSMAKGADLLGELEDFLSSAENARTVLEDFHGNGGDLSIVITMASGTGLSELDWKMLRRLSGLNIALEIATYIDNRKFS